MEASSPTEYAPGSNAKIELLRARHRYGLPLFVEGDNLDASSNEKLVLARIDYESPRDGPRIYSLGKHV